jgi:hypothetical protein
LYDQPSRVPEVVELTHIEAEPVLLPFAAGSVTSLAVSRDPVSVHSRADW